MAKRKRVPYPERPIPKGLVQVEVLVPGEWVRAAWYTEGHKVDRDGVTAICGRPLDLDLHPWVVLETRKTIKCSQCANERTEDYSLAPTEDPWWVLVASQTSRLPLGTEARRAALLLESKVSLVKRLMGAREME